jgi:dihydroxyacetone kinase phosphoprotein-dependent L subunit
MLLYFSMDTLTQQQVELIIKTMADTAIENEAYFSELDGVMGDADFGVSLAGGFRAVLKGWDGFDRSNIGSLLLNVAAAITANTGGCSGPVWGTLFMRFGMTFKEKSGITLGEIIAAFKSAIDGISKRGGAVLGDKTLLDALNAIMVSLEESANGGTGLLTALKRASDAAVETRETTKGWTAKRGRQSFTGDRSIGTYDPGIVAIGDMSVAIVKALEACGR